MSLNSFISEVKTKGLARTNRYEVYLPAALGGSTDLQTARVFCDAIQIPGLNIATTQQRIYGEQRELPYERMVDPLNMSFYVDSEMRVKKMFDMWINSVINPLTKVTNYYNNYVHDITINVLPVDENSPSYSVTLREAYPKSVSPIQMDAASREVMKVNVTLMYKYFVVEGLDVGSATSAVQNTMAAITIGRQDPESILTSAGYGPTALDMFNE